jgi:hypothetical protein
MAWGVPKIGAVATVASGNITLAEPAGIAQGDLMVACIGYRSNAAFTVPGDWNLVATQQSSGDTDATNGIASGLMMWCVRGASAPTLTFNRTAGDVAQGRIIAYSGGHASAPYDTGSSNTRTSGNVSAFTDTITTAEAGELIVAMVSAGDNLTTSGFLAVTDPTTASGATDTTTAPTAGTWIERADTGTGTGADHGLAIADAVKATAGATGTISATVSAAAQHVMIAGAFKLAASGTPFTQNLGGSITPAGTIVKAPTQRKLGGITPTGALIRLGTHFRTLSGVVTPGGSLVKAFPKAFSGAITPAGSSVTVRFFTSSLAGTIGAVGSIVKLVSKQVSGILVPAGSLRKEVVKRFLGVLTPTGTVRKADSKSFSGTLSPSGLLRKDTFKSLISSVTPSGAIRKVVTLLKQGTVTSSGQVSSGGNPVLNVSGMLTPTGTVTRSTSQRTVGAIVPTGVSVKGVTVIKRGTLVPSGVLSALRGYGKALSGMLAPSGTLRQAVSKSLVGVINLSGSLIKTVAKYIAGLLTPSGVASHDFLGDFEAGQVRATISYATGLSVQLLPTLTVEVYEAVDQRIDIQG